MAVVLYVSAFKEYHNDVLYSSYHYVRDAIAKGYQSLSCRMCVSILYFMLLIMYYHCAHFILHLIDNIHN